MPIKKKKERVETQGEILYILKHDDSISLAFVSFFFIFVKVLFLPSLWLWWLVVYYLFMRTWQMGSGRSRDLRIWGC